MKALGGTRERSIEKNGGNNEVDAGGSKGDGDGRRREGHPNVVSMLDAFVHRGGGSGGGLTDGGFHCLVFELLSHSLYDVLRSTSFKGVSLGLIRKFARQILSALSFLRSRGVVHCDLKPENVLLVSADRSAVKLIDFGSLPWATPGLHGRSSRFYRAAEVTWGCRAAAGRLLVAGVIWSDAAGTHSSRKGRKGSAGEAAGALGPVPRWMCDRCPPEKRSMHYPHPWARRREKEEQEEQVEQVEQEEQEQEMFPFHARPLRGIMPRLLKFELSRHSGGGEDVSGPGDQPGRTPPRLSRFTPSGSITTPRAASARTRTQRRRAPGAG